MENKRVEISLVIDLNEIQTRIQVYNLSVIHVFTTWKIRNFLFGVGIETSAGMQRKSRAQYFGIWVNFAIYLLSKFCVLIHNNPIGICAKFGKELSKLVSKLQVKRRVKYFSL